MTLRLISVISFVVIRPSPGDMVSSDVTRQEIVPGAFLPEETLGDLRDRYGFDGPLRAPSVKWVSGLMQGDFGLSVINDGAPVADTVAPVGDDAAPDGARLGRQLGHRDPAGHLRRHLREPLRRRPDAERRADRLSIPDLPMAIVCPFAAIFLWA